MSEIIQGRMVTEMPVANQVFDSDKLMIIQNNVSKQVDSSVFGNTFGKQSDFLTTDVNDPSYIKNKPDLTVFVEKEVGKGLSSNDFSNARIQELENKVDKEEGRSLTDNNFSDALLEKLDLIEDGAQVNPNFKTINGQVIVGTGNIQIESLVIDNLTTNSTTSALSANQGKILKNLIDNKKDEHAIEYTDNRIDTGMFVMDSIQNLIYKGTITTNKTLVEADIVPTYATTYLHFTNTSTNNVIITLPNTGIYEALMDSMITLEPTESVQITIKGYGPNRKLYYIHSNGSSFVSNLLIGLIFRPPVATVAALTTTYPNAQKGWASLVNATETIYQFDGTSWNNTGLHDFPQSVLADISELQTAVFVNVGWVDVENITWTTGSYVDKNGTITSLSSYKMSNLIPVVQGEKYTANLRGGAGGSGVIGSAVVSGWNNGTFNPNLMVPGTDSQIDQIYTFTVPANVTHIRLSTALTTINPYLKKYMEGGDIKVSRIQLLKEQVESLINSQVEDTNGLLAAFKDFTGNTTIIGTGTILGGGTFRTPFNTAIEDIDFAAKIKLLVNGIFGLCRQDTTYGTAIAVNGNIIEVRKMNGSTGVKTHSFNLPFTVEVGKEYIIRLFKQNKDIFINVHSDNQYFTQFVERTDELDFGRNWGPLGVFCQTGQIQILDAVVRDASYESPTTFCLGDSFVEGWGIVNNLDKRYVALMQDYTFGDVFIAGIGGETTTSLLTRFDTELEKVNSKYVLLGLGTNDTNISTYISNMDILISKIKGKNRIPILVTVTPRSGSYPIANMNNYVRTKGEFYIDMNAAVNLNGNELAWNPLYVNSDNVHPNVLGNSVMFNRMLHDVYFIFDTRVIYNSSQSSGSGSLTKTDVQQIVNDSTLPVSSIAVKNSLNVLTIGNIITSLTSGKYVQPNTGELLTSNEYHYSNFIKVTPGMKLLISGTFAYNSSIPASNAGIAGYSDEDVTTFVAPVFTLPMAGITTAGRSTITNFELTVPTGVNYIIGSSVFATSILEINDATTGPISTVVPGLINKINTLENQVFIIENLDFTDLVVQGTFDIDGTPVNGQANRIRVDETYTGEMAEILNINPGFNYIVWGWKADGTLVGHEGWQTVPKTFNLEEYGYDYVRFAFKRNNDTAIIPSDYPSVGFNARMNTSLKTLILGGSGSIGLADDIISRNKEAEKAALAVRKRFDTQNTTNETDFGFFAHISDLHNDPVRLKNFIKYCEHLKVDAGFVTGDIVDLYFTDDFTYYTKQVLATTIPMFNTIGNHEAQNGGTDEQLEAKFFTPLIPQNESISEGKGYYYRDFADKKIRIIGLNQFQEGGTARERRYLKPDQISWLIATLKSTPAGYGIMILTHVPEHEWSAEPTKTKFWQDKMFFTDLFSNITGSPIADLIDAFIGRTTINKSYVQSGVLPIISINADFSTGVNNGVEFIAYANGHLHADRIGYLNNTTHKQLVLNIVCGNAFVSPWRDGLSDLPRKAGTVAEDAINIYGIDRITKNVKIVRIGSNVNYMLEKRDLMSISYI